MEYAIIKTGGKQYKAAVGMSLEIDKINLAPGDSYTFDNVLLYTADGISKIGHPQVSGVTVTAKILEQIKGDKIRIAKFKAKARYRKVAGHRQLLTKVQITEIVTKSETSKPEKK